jgi:hypothetical protein
VRGRSPLEVGQPRFQQTNPAPEVQQREDEHQDDERRREEEETECDEWNERQPSHMTSWL